MQLDHLAIYDRKLSVSSMAHIPVLDGLRALAIGLVFLGHASYGKFAPGGFGVTIFFFLSGFLITSLMRLEWSRKGALDFKAFYLRRILRINPPLWITMILIGLATAGGMVSAQVDLIAVAAQALFAINYTPLWGHADGLPGMPLWSLAVEEHFYLVFPLAFSIMRARLTVAQTAFVCAIICLVVLLVRVAYVGIAHETYYTYFWTHTRIDSILFGCILALWQNPVLERDVWKPKLWHVGTALGVLAVCLIVRSPALRETIRYTLQGGALFVLFSYVLQARGMVRHLLDNPVVRRLGLYSYTFYLAHYFMLLLVRQHLPSLTILPSAVVAGGLTFGYAALMYRLVERPLARLRRQIDPARTLKSQKSPISSPAMLADESLV